MKITRSNIYKMSPMLAVLTAMFFSFNTSVQAAEKDPKAGDVSRGAMTWGQNCNRCHEMRSPTEFRDDVWKPIMAHMRVKAGLTGQQQRDVLAFLQASNHPTSAATSAVTEDGPGSGLSGAEIYSQTCLACHGGDGKGAIGGVPDFTKSDGRLAKSDEALMHSITVGFQTPGSPMAMPAKGGNPNLNTADVKAVLEYMRNAFAK